MLMRYATLISWLVTASLGAFMLRTWLARGGPRRERARAGGLPPQLIFGHGGLALTGLLVWSAFVATGAKAVAWTAVGLLMVVVGLGLSMVTIWTPYPGRKPGERRAPSPWGEPAVVVPDTPAAAADPPDPVSTPDPLDSVITDEMIAQLLEDRYHAGGHRPIRPNLEVLIPIAHGFAAIGTFVLAVMTASM
jgi:manganese efflux pump family protein